jgi:CRP/FNR family transcriptional regulator
VASAGPDIDEALRLSFLGGLPRPVAERLLEGAWLLEAGAGRQFSQRPGEPSCGIILDGLLRLYLTAEDGRQVTFRYARRGQFVGAALVVEVGAIFGVEAATDVRILALEIERVRALARKEASVAWAMAWELARYQAEIVRVFAGTAFGTIRQRTARHLLDLASGAASEGPLVATATQQGIADAVGSSREVVARALRELREAGLIATDRQRVRVLDPAGLAEEAEEG